ncbi:Crp/Fnr family transcriptional regulator [Sedimentitalea sp. XS_ASV28]|uniref:Crp/Fnr family transcriptional regulator n=1 Tax=Sedimentitalea sp. XS_ASV28 TaxID=3241296 RepID=UPI00351940F9
MFIRSLPDEHIETVLSRGVFRSSERGETLFIQGEPCPGIHVVLEGWVKLYRIAPNGSEAVVGVFTKGESMGEPVALRQGTYPVSAEAATACTTVLIPGDALIQLIRRDPEVSISILASTFNHLHSLVSQLEQLKAETGAQRVARFLLELCEDGEDECRVTLPYDKVLIAGRLGMKPESLSRAFARLKDSGVTIARNHAEISDIRRLRGVVESDPADAWHR